MKRISFELLISCVFILAACATTPSTTTNPPGETRDASPTGTAISVPTAVVPSATFEPTATPAPGALNPDGPYVLFEGERGIWIANPDGSFPTRMSESGFVTPFQDPHRAISSSGDWLAQIIATDSGADLVLVHLPDGEAEVVAHLSDRPDSSDIASQVGLAFHAITNYDNLAWQPDGGTLLAFIGALDGLTADLYIYDTQSRDITRLTDGLSQALYPSWSPDGEYILQFGGSWISPLGGALVGYNRADGAWAVRVGDGTVIRQPGDLKSHYNFIGWVDGDHYLYSDSDDDCSTRDIRSASVSEASATTLFKGCYYSYDAFSPESGAVLFSSHVCETCPLGEGTFLLLPGEVTASQIWGDISWGIDWLPESGAFYAYPNGALSGDGLVRYDPPVPDASSKPTVSRLGWIAWVTKADGVGQVLVGLPGEVPLTLDVVVGAMLWDPEDGNTLVMVTGGGTVYSATSPDFILRVQGELGDTAGSAIWVP